MLNLVKDFNGAITRLMESVAEKRNNWNDFAGLHAFTMFMVMTIGLIAFGGLAVHADYSVLYSMFFNTSGEVLFSGIKAIVFASTIFFAIMISTSKIVYIKNRQLDKKMCLDENDKPVVNSKYKYHKKMLKMYWVLVILPSICTLYLSLNTDQIVKAKSGFVLDSIEDKTTKRDSINLTRGDRKMVSINRTFKNDSLVLFQSTRDKIRTADPKNYEKWVKTKERIKQWKKLAKIGTEEQKKEAPKSIAALERMLTTYKQRINEASAPIKKERAKELERLSKIRESRISSIYISSESKDSISTELYKGNVNKLKDSELKAGATLIGMNFFFNIMNIVLSRLLTLFYIGVNLGNKPVEREKKTRQQTSFRQATKSSDKVCDK